MLLFLRICRSMDRRCIAGAADKGVRGGFAFVLSGTQTTAGKQVGGSICCLCTSNICDAETHAKLATAHFQHDSTKGARLL